MAHPCLRTVSSGDVTAADEQALNKAISPGGPFANLPILGMVEPGTNYSAEARKAFTFGANTGGPVLPIAVVVTSAPLRVMLGFVIRISGAAESTRFFAVESEALAWLDEKLSAKAP
jgi:hypothetical protein